MIQCEKCKNYSKIYKNGLTYSWCNIAEKKEDNSIFILAKYEFPCPWFKENNL